MKARVVGLAAGCLVITAFGVQWVEVSALRQEVARLRAAVENQKRTPAPAFIPVQAPVTPRKAGPVFRLIGDQPDAGDAIERGMKADELEQRTRRREWGEQMEYPFSPEDQYNPVPPWADGAIPKFH